MLGAIVGDIVGSIYEHENHRSKEFPLFKDSSRFTDDSVLTCATAAVLMDGGDYSDLYRNLRLQYPRAGYGARFMHWLMDDSMGPYDSYGNGSAMRVSLVGWAYDSKEEVLAAASVDARIRILEAQFCQRLWLFHKFTAALLDLGKFQRHAGF